MGGSGIFWSDVNAGLPACGATGTGLRVVNEKPTDWHVSSKRQRDSHSSCSSKGVEQSVGSKYLHGSRSRKVNTFGGRSRHQNLFAAESLVASSKSSPDRSTKGFQWSSGKAPFNIWPRPKMGAWKEMSNKKCDLSNLIDKAPTKISTR